MDAELPEPPMYFPLRHGRYDVAPGLNRFGKDLGGGSADRHVFQIDRTFGQFRAAKLASRAEQVDRYFHTHALRDDVASDIIVFIAGRLVTEYPDHFYGQRSGDHIELRCRLTGDTVPLNRSPPHLLDAIACQVQEDLAIVSGENARHWLSAAHVCFPNGWAPHEKVGKSFAGFHEPVAGMEEMNRRESHFADIMVNAAEGLVRFAWGVTFDDRLNHHPALPSTPFDPSNPRAFLRVERQTIWGFPQRGAALFTIRTYLYDCDDLRRDPMARDPLISALRSMSPASRTYKGLAEGFDDLVNWLAAGGSGRG